MDKTVEEQLIADGWKEYPHSFPDQGAIEARYFQRQVPGVFGCLTNEKICVNLKFTRYLSCEYWVLELIAEPTEGKWVKLESYTLDADSLLKSLPIEERKLVAAWKAILQVAEAEIDGDV